MYSTTTIAGYIGRDPEMRYLRDGTAVTNLSVGVSVGWGDNEHTQWYRVSCWQKTAEAVNQHLTKGDPVLVRGTLKADKETGGPVIYERRDGSVGASFEMNADRVVFLPRKGGRDDRISNEEYVEQKRAQRQANEGETVPGEVDPDDESIPW